MRRACRRRASVRVELKAASRDAAVSQGRDLSCRGRRRHNPVRKQHTEAAAGATFVQREAMV